MDHKTDESKVLSNTDNVLTENLSQSIQVNEILQNKQIKDFLKNIFNEKKTFEEGDFQIYSEPFPHCCINNFLIDVRCNEEISKYLESLQDELLQYTFHPKENDLYRFYQTDDIMLNDCENTDDKTHLNHFRNLLITKFLPWMQENSGVNLNNQVDMFSALYGKNDFLLCHDDQLEGREIAYIYYLSPEWKENYGGHLELFSSKTTKTKKGLVYEPSNVVKSILPKNNSLVFFYVNEQSFHQVKEVLSDENTRMTITGWFHSDSKKQIDSLTLPPPSVLTIPLEPNDQEILSWLNPKLFQSSHFDLLKSEFEETSTINISDFLETSKYKQVADALSFLSCLENSEEYFQREYLANSYHYDNFKANCFTKIVELQKKKRELAEDEKNTELITSLKSIKYLIEIFSSQKMFNFISKLTGVSLIQEDTDEDGEPSAKKSRDISCKSQIRSWKNGHYTLLRDMKEHNFQEDKVIEFILYFKVNEDWDESCGGATYYCVADEQEPVIFITSSNLTSLIFFFQLLDVFPFSNQASLVYREKHCSSFVSYISQKAPTRFFDLKITYFENE